MPELPEVETVRRGLEPVLVGQRLVKVVLLRPDLRFAFPDDFVARLEEKSIVRLSRRAKYLLAYLSSGEILVMHLGMSGRFVIELPAQTALSAKPKASSRQQPGFFAHETPQYAKHDHVVFETVAGARVIYNDARRFGFMLLLDEASVHSHKLFCHLGPEPLGNTMNAAYLASVAQGRNCDLKAFLMDQKNIAGLGNIYVCEALHRARLSPLRRAATLASKTGKPLARCEALVAAIGAVLRAAIAAGGSTLRDYLQTDGSLGYFQHGFQVYDRAGLACLRPACGGQIRRRVQAGRSTFYCPRCQK